MTTSHFIQDNGIERERDIIFTRFRAKAIRCPVTDMIIGSIYQNGSYLMRFGMVMKV